MSEQLPTLQLMPNMSMIVLKRSGNRQQFSALGDIQRIHDPSTTSFGRAIRRFVGSFDLYAKPHDNACATFSGSAYRDEFEPRVTLCLENLEQPGQLAGWAAMQLYRQKTEGTTLPHIDVVDPTETSGIQALQKRFSRRDNPALSRGSVLRPNQLSMVPFGGDVTLVRAHGPGKPLPDLLAVIKKGYDELYPDSDTSQAIGGIVGAQNLEAFGESWFRAANRPDPVAAARMLLESDVFLRT
jgi:hypothetical protein